MSYGISKIGISRGIGIGRRIVGGQIWSSLYYILKSGAIWYRRETNTAGGYFILWYSSDSGGTWEELMNLDLTEDSVVIDLAHLYTHRITGTAYEVLDGVDIIYST